MQKVLSSRRFWTFIVTGLVNVIVYFTGRYYQANLQDVTVILGFVDGLAGILIALFTVDDVNERQTAERLEQARIRQQTLDPVPTDTTAKAQALWHTQITASYPPPGPDKETSDQDRSRART